MPSVPGSTGDLSPNDEYGFICNDLCLLLSVEEISGYDIEGVNYSEGTFTTLYMATEQFQW